MLSCDLHIFICASLATVLGCDFSVRKSTAKLFILMKEVLGLWLPK